MGRPQILVGVNIGINRVHTIIVREEASGNLRLMGEHRGRDVINEGDQAGLINCIKKSIAEAIRDAKVSLESILAIGIALPGQINTTHEVLLFAPNIKLADVAITDALKENYNCHIALINDVAALGIGEQRIGAGKHTRHAVYLYVSYGIGSSIIIDEHLYTGADNVAGEIGHTSICFDGPLCSCGKHGCLEAFSSRRAITQKLQALYREGKDTILAKIANLDEESLDLNSAIIVEAIEREDPLTIQVIEEAARLFGIGVASVIDLLNPHAIILGGDVIDEIDLFFERAVVSMRERSLRDNVRNLSIVRGVLGTTAGAYGAAVFAKQHLNRQD